MTPEKIEAILKTVALGLHPERAALAHGVDPATMRKHKQRNPEFVTAIKEAEAKAESGFLSAMMLHTEKNWTCLAWLLERRWPMRWARRDAPPQDETPQQTAAKIQAALSHLAASVPNVAPPAPPTDQPPTAPTNAPPSP
jgi:hypothetical protein